MLKLNLHQLITRHLQGIPIGSTGAVIQLHGRALRQRLGLGLCVIWAEGILNTAPTNTNARAGIADLIFIAVLITCTRWSHAREVLADFIAATIVITLTRGLGIAAWWAL